MSNSFQSTRPVGRVLWEELLEEVILHITPLCSLLHTLLKDKCVCLQASENCKSLILQDKCNIEIFLSPPLNILSPFITLCSESNLCFLFFYLVECSNIKIWSC